ncbi:MAG TPA: hypothetical protein VND93_10495 [Myxococcales bacterium]|nr:hypothetical protein [Myxococcales bacterium]
MQPGSPGQRSVPSLKEWLRGRYAERSRFLYKESTAGVFESYVRYLIYYLGDRPLGEVARLETLNWYVERRLQDPALSFDPGFVWNAYSGRNASPSASVPPDAPPRRSPGSTTSRNRGFFLSGGQGSNRRPELGKVRLRAGS